MPATNAVQHCSEQLLTLSSDVCGDRQESQHCEQCGCTVAGGRLTVLPSCHRVGHKSRTRNLLARSTTWVEWDTLNGRWRQVHHEPLSLFHYATFARMLCLSLLHVRLLQSTQARDGDYVGYDQAVHSIHWVIQLSNCLGAPNHQRAGQCYANWLWRCITGSCKRSGELARPILLT